ncbi:ABC transporter substrate-binding protein [Kitasatospora kifunensis]|uniref:ABC-type branched-subunit amino acid transport system substrate-binding protein n=1 Tax=Kitasatospora kifunensis TaxID=58351 RepID=A0A7W7QWT2_KITKI|nr:ABC transporter substrate-binding protein [Kitasatospora kifunensis]MBB4921187.1 ABC-type branched-subunit amino acid transport system substrate-binding protein [Kitasatospora kifunensis]
MHLFSRSGSADPNTEPWDPPRPWWRGWQGLTALVAVLALLGGGLYALLQPPGTGCATGVARRGPDHVCVGLSNGSFPFTTDLAQLSGLVQAENQRVLDAAAKPGGAPWVSVVYLLPMLPSEDSTNTADSMRHELEGAYTAQWEANHSHSYGDSPQIRLLLANPGGYDAQRTYTLDQIEAQRTAQHIVAVAGLGTSTAATRASILRLTQENIAAFGSVITADDLSDIPGLVRVAPPNADEAAAAAAYLTKDHPGAKVLLVQDRKAGDLYSSTLADQFGKSYPAGQLVQQPMEYDSSKSDVSTYFTQQMANVCLADPDVIFFAGRGIDLPRFLAPLSKRYCAQKTLTVISGDDASQVEQSAGISDVKEALRLGNIKLLYTGLAHPDAWTLRPQSYSPTAIAPFLAGGEFVNAFPHESLADGQAIMGHDAMLTAVSAIRDAALGGNDQVSGQDVVQMLTALYGASAVSGASGLISLDSHGNPVNKALPIVELSPDGQVRTVAVSSRTGTPSDWHP